MYGLQGLQYVQYFHGQLDEKKKKETMHGLQFVQSFQGLQYAQSFHDQLEEKRKKEIMGGLQRLKKSQSFNSLSEEEKKKEIMVGFQYSLSFHARKIWKKEIMGSLPNLQFPLSFHGLSKEKLKKEIRGGLKRLQYAQSFHSRSDKRQKEKIGRVQGLQYALSFQDRPSSSTIYSAIDTRPEREASETHLCAEIQRLQELGNFLSAGWLRQALDVCLSMHREVQEISPQIGQVLLRQNAKWMDETLDDTVKLLDVCNALRDNMRDMKQHREKLHLVLHCFNGPINAAQLVRARTALSSFNESSAKAQSISGLENCSSMLRRMGEKRVSQSAGPDSVEAIYAAKDLTVFVCGLLIAALSTKSRYSLPLPCAGHSPWACAFQTLYFKVKKEVERRRNKGTFRVLLDELHAVDSSSRVVYDLLVNSKSVPLDERQDLELRKSVVCLKKCIAELEDGMAPLQNQINELFSVVVADRMAMLDALSYS